MGRPPKPAAEKRAHTVQVTFTEGEFKRLDKIADGRPLAAFVRKIVLKKHPEIQGRRKR
jgi:hypothetical protein